MIPRPTIRQVVEDFISATSGQQDDWALWRLRQLREQAVVALRGNKAPPPVGDGWNLVETIPRDRKVMVKTVTGMERVAKVVHGAGVVRGRVHCWRRDKGKTGDLQAVAWKELEPGEPK